MPLRLQGPLIEGALPLRLDQPGGRGGRQGQGRQAKFDGFAKGRETRAGEGVKRRITHVEAQPEELVGKAGLCVRRRGEDAEEGDDAGRTGLGRGRGEGAEEGGVVLLDGGRIIADGPTLPILSDEGLLEAHGLEVPLSLKLGKRRGDHGVTEEVGPTKPRGGIGE